MNKSSYAVVTNGKSRSGVDATEAVRGLLEPGAAIFRLTDSLKAFDKSFEEIKAKGIETALVGGGDGTIRRAAKHLVGTNIVLGILPFGTGNSLARELEIPLEPELAADFLLNVAQTRGIDVGTFNDEVFVNVATLGVTSRIVTAVNALPKDKLGRWVYLPAVLSATVMARSTRIRVTTPDDDFEGKAIQLVAASTRLHGGPFAVTKNAAIDDGKLSIYVLEKGDRIALAEFGLALVTGRHTELPNVWSVDVSEATIQLSRPSRFILDGDAVRASFVKLGVRRQGLQVLAQPVSVT